MARIVNSKDKGIYINIIILKTFWLDSPPYLLAKRGKITPNDVNKIVEYIVSKKAINGLILGSCVKIVCPAFVVAVWQV